MNLYAPKLTKKSENGFWLLEIPCDLQDLQNGGGAEKLLQDKHYTHLKQQLKGGDIVVAFLFDGFALYKVYQATSGKIYLLEFTPTDEVLDSIKLEFGLINIVLPHENNCCASIVEIKANTRKAMQDIKNLEETFIQLFTNVNQVLHLASKGAISLRSALKVVEEHGKTLAKLTEDVSHLSENSARALWSSTKAKNVADKTNKKVFEAADSASSAILTAVSVLKDVVEYELAGLTSGLRKIGELPDYSVKKPSHLVVVGGTNAS